MVTLQGAFPETGTRNPHRPPPGTQVVCEGVLRITFPAMTAFFSVHFRHSTLKICDCVVVTVFTAIRDHFLGECYQGNMSASGRMDFVAAAAICGVCNQYEFSAFFDALFEVLDSFQFTHDFHLLRIIVVMRVHQLHYPAPILQAVN